MQNLGTTKRDALTMIRQMLGDWAGEENAERAFSVLRATGKIIFSAGAWLLKQTEDEEFFDSGFVTKQ